MNTYECFAAEWWPDTEKAIRNQWVAHPSLLRSRTLYLHARDISMVEILIERTSWMKHAIQRGDRRDTHFRDSLQTSYSTHVEDNRVVYGMHVIDRRGDEPRSRVWSLVSQSKKLTGLAGRGSATYTSRVSSGDLCTIVIEYVLFIYF